VTCVKNDEVRRKASFDHQELNIEAKYSPETSVPHQMGTVGKCDFCPDFAKRGELPDCVTACPNGVIYFGDKKKKKLYNRMIWGLAVACITIILTGAFTIGANWKNTQINKESLDLLKTKVEAIDNLYVPAKLYFHVNRTVDLEFQAVLAQMDEKDAGKLAAIMKEFHDFRWSLIATELPAEVVRSIEKEKEK